MTLGMIFLYGNGILAYRVLQNQAKKQVKIIHGVVMISVFIIDVIGLQAVFDFHNLKNIPNMYSLHSWLGLARWRCFCFSGSSVWSASSFQDCQMILERRFCLSTSLLEFPSSFCPGPPQSQESPRRLSS